MRFKSFLLLALLVFATAGSFGQSALDLQPNDSMQTILQRQVGQPVELRMNSGENMGGKLEKVNDKLAHLS